MVERQSFYVGVKTIITRKQGSEVLVLQDTSRNKWELPGGRIDGSQSIYEAVERELPEEIIGSRLEALGQLVHADTGDFVVENNHRLCLLFYLASVSIPEIIELSDEHISSHWTTSTELDSFDMFSTDKKALELYFGKNWGEL